MSKKVSYTGNSQTINSKPTFTYADVNKPKEEVPSGGNADCDWNLMKNKPFYEVREHDDIVWDGNTEGLESANTGMMLYCYKLAEDYSHMEVTDFVGATIKPPGFDTFTITEEHISDDNLSVVVVAGGFVQFAFIKDGGSVDFIGSKPGLWLAKNTGGTFMDGVKFPCEIVPLELKFSPHFIVNTTDINNNKVDRTFEEIYNAVQAGAIVELRTKGMGMFRLAWFEESFIEFENTRANQFTGDNGSITQQVSTIVITVFNDNTVETSYITIPIPTATV